MRLQLKPNTAPNPEIILQIRRQAFHLAAEALDAANGVIDLLTAYNVGVSFLSEERVEIAMEKYRAALKKIRGEK